MRVFVDRRDLPSVFEKGPGTILARTMKKEEGMEICLVPRQLALFQQRPRDDLNVLSCGEPHTRKRENSVPDCGA